MSRKALEEAQTRYGAGNPATPDCSEYDEALEILDDLVASGGAPVILAQARNLRWHIRYLRGDREGALDDLSEAIALLPAYGAAFYNRGYVLESMGRSSEARGDFRAALRFAERTDDGDLADAAEVHLAELARRRGTARVDVDGRRTQR